MSQGLHRLDVLVHRYDGVEGVAGGIDLVHPVKHLPAALFVGLQLRAKIIGVPHKGHNGDAAGYGSMLEDRVHIDKIDIVVFLRAGGVEDGASGGQHLRQPGTGADFPQGSAEDLSLGVPQEFQV